MDRMPGVHAELSETGVRSGPVIITPTGIFVHSIDDPDFRAEGTIRRAGEQQHAPVICWPRSRSQLNRSVWPQGPRQEMTTNATQC
jgi:hypothetical protein